MAKPHKNIVYYIFSKLYGGISEFRNFLFDRKILSSVKFPMPIISVGNLAVGGTGKTPHTEFLLRILNEKWKTAVLSRGYKRQTSGFVLADEHSNAKQIGDEPFQIFGKFPQIRIAVDEKRVHGVHELMKQFPDTEVIVLDDAFQHRHIQPGLNILLTDYKLLFTDDHMLPYGTLRELPKNSRRADMVIITKCPADIQLSDKAIYRRKLSLNSSQELYFSTFEYGAIYSVFNENVVSPELNSGMTVLLVTGIENPKPLLHYLKQQVANVIEFAFPDHHEFSENDLQKIEKKFNETKDEKLIITTEKDAARLKSNHSISEVIKNNIFALPLQVKILDNEQEKFINKIYDYVRKNSTNS